MTRSVAAGRYYPNLGAVDFYGHYKDDIRSFAEMGFKCVRTSIAWTRIFPIGPESQPNDAVLKTYDAMLVELLN